MNGSPHVLVRVCGAIIAAAVILSPCPILAAGVPFGVAEIAADSTGCLAMEGVRLHVGDSLMVAGFNPVALIRGQVVGERQGACAEHEGVLGDSVFSYTIRLEPDGPIEDGMGVAVITPGAMGALVAGRVEVRIPGAEQPCAFRQCASMEGVHFTAWEGERCVWHAYYYVPFELEPDCTEEEIAAWPRD